MNGQIVEHNAFQADVGLEWQVAQIGDFNGDLRDDLLWRNTSTGQIATWEFEGDGTSVNPNVFRASVGLDWTIQTNQYDFV